MTNPFDDEDGEFSVLINDEGQHSLWPVQFEVPAGWRAIGPQGTRQTCMAWIDENWRDMRPLSLIREMNALENKSLS
jgi:MbtH protein